MKRNFDFVWGVKQLMSEVQGMLPIRDKDSIFTCCSM